jgi:TPR repeat protein
MGSAYYYGTGVPQDYAAAAQWYRKAADQGYGNALSALGTLFYYGRGVPQDRAEAVRWYRKAAAQGDEGAKSVLTTHPRTPTQVFLSTVVLGSVLLLIFAHRAGGVFDPRERTTTLAGFLGFLYVGLDLYRYFHLGILQPVPSAFYFGKSLLAGTYLVTLLWLLLPTSAKVLLQMSLVLFVGFNFYVYAYYELAHFETSARVFYSINGWLAGVSICSALLLWRAKRFGRVTADA